MLGFILFDDAVVFCARLGAGFPIADELAFVLKCLAFDIVFLLQVIELTGFAESAMCHFCRLFPAVGFRHYR